MGIFNPDLAFSYIELGALREAHGISGGIELIKKGYEVLDQMLGSKHPRSILAALRLSFHLASCHETAVGERLYRTAIQNVESLETRDGSLHPDFQRYLALCRHTFG